MHRFYIKPGTRELRQHLWIDDRSMVHQWQKVLRFKVGDELVLFDGDCDKLYKIDRVEDTAFHLEHVTDMVQNLPGKDMYLFWSLLNKRDKNEMVLQKCTELGVSVFIPVISERSEAKNLHEERAQKIVIEAAEQCGRSDIPTIHEPMTFEQAVSSYNDKLQLFYTDVEAESAGDRAESKLGVFIGPEGGWSKSELQALRDVAEPLSLGNLTLRAETAAITASHKLMHI